MFSENTEHNDGFQNLIQGINFDSPVKENQNPHNSYVDVNSLISGVDFDSPIETPTGDTCGTMSDFQSILDGIDFNTTVEGNATMDMEIDSVLKKDHCNEVENMEVSQSESDPNINYNETVTTPIDFSTTLSPLMKSTQNFMDSGIQVCILSLLLLLINYSIEVFNVVFFVVFHTFLRDATHFLYCEYYTDGN